MIQLFGTRICPLDLVTDERTNRLSSTKIWLHIAHFILSYAVLKHVTQHPLTFDVILAYGGVVAGHHSLVYLIKKKYGETANVDSSPDAPKE